MITMTSVFLFTTAWQITNENRSTTQNVSFAIYKTADYEADIYKNTSVKLSVTIEKIKDGKRMTLWNQSFLPAAISSFPDSGKAIPQTLRISNLNSGEKLQVIYTLAYNTNGKELVMSGMQAVNSDNMVVNISI